MVACSNALAASTACRVTERWFTPQFSVLAEFGIRQWTAEVSGPSVTQPLWPACWVDTLDRSSLSESEIVHDSGNIYRKELGVVPPDLILALRAAFVNGSVDEFWDAWSAGAGAGLLRACHRAVCLVASGIQAFLGRGRLRTRKRRLGEEGRRR